MVYIFYMHMLMNVHDVWTIWTIREARNTLEQIFYQKAKGAASGCQWTALWSEAKSRKMEISLPRPEPQPLFQVDAAREASRMPWLSALSMPLHRVYLASKKLEYIPGLIV